MTRYDDLLNEVQELRREVADLRDDDDENDETIPEGQAQAVEDLCDRLLWYRSRGWSDAEAETEAELESITGTADVAVLREQLPDRELENEGDGTQQRIADLEDAVQWYESAGWDSVADDTRREIAELKS
jgi:cell division protein FtsB